jgi:hypothetical protein
MADQQGDRKQEGALMLVYDTEENSTQGHHMNPIFIEEITTPYKTARGLRLERRLEIQLERAL